MDCRPGCGRQLFGQKSEKRLELDDGAQLHLLAGLGVERPPPRDDGPTETDERRAKVRDAKVAESRLRFGADVPAQTIEVTDPAIEAIPEAEREVIGEKVSYRLAQQPGSYNGMTSCNNPNPSAVYRTLCGAINWCGHMSSRSAMSSSTQDGFRRGTWRVWRSTTKTRMDS